MMPARDRLHSTGATRRVTVPVICLLAVALLAAMLAGGCNEEARAPRAALMKFFEAEHRGDVKGAYALLSRADTEQMDLAAWTRMTTQDTPEAPIKGLHLMISEAVLTDSGATVDVLLGDDADPGNARDLRFIMVKEGGTWKVAFLKTISGPSRHVETGGGINWGHVAFGSGTESAARTVVHIVMLLAIYAFYGIGLQRVARIKELKRPWFAWVPILNIYIAWKIAGKGVVSTVLSLIPFVSIVMYIIFCFKFARACGKGRLYGFLQIVPILNFVIFWLLVQNVEDTGLELEAQPA
jgi:hypothetical protein